MVEYVVPVEKLLQERDADAVRVGVEVALGWKTIVSGHATVAGSLTLLSGSAFFPAVARSAIGVWMRLLATSMSAASFAACS